MMRGTPRNLRSKYARPDASVIMGGWQAGEEPVRVMPTGSWMPAGSRGSGGSGDSLPDLPDLPDPLAAARPAKRPARSLAGDRAVGDDAPAVHEHVPDADRVMRRIVEGRHVAD